MNLSNKNRVYLLKAIAIFFIIVSLVSFFGNDLVCYDKGIWLSIIATLILGCYGFPVYLREHNASTYALLGQREIARVMSWYGLFLLIIGFILQLSFWS